MSSLILRPLFVLLTLAMLIMAFFQVSGRLLLSVLDELEVGVNQWLSTQQIVVSGLAGDWRRINPVIRIDSVTLPAGHLKDIHVEVDWLESLIRNRLVAQRISLGEGRLLLSRTDAGWRLLGAAEGGEFNPFSTLYHSDQIDVALSIGFVDEHALADPEDDLTLTYLATNRGGGHRHRIQLGNANCFPDCGLALAMDEQEAVPLLREREIQASISGGDLRLPAPLLVADGGRIGSVSGFWWRQGDRSGGEGHLNLADLAIDDEVVGGGLRIASRGEGDTHHISLSEVEVTGTDSRWALPPFWLTLENGETESLLTAWTERLETGVGFQFIAALAPRETAAFRWLNALNAKATALNVHAFVRYPGLESGYLATVRDVSIDGYNGAPWIRGAAGELLGANRLLQLTVNADDVGVQFPDMFRERWDMDHLSGRIQAYISLDYFALRGTHLKAEINGSHASAAFALSRPQGQRYRERLSLLLNVDRTTVARGKSYIPYKLPAGLPEWLDNGPRSGELTDVAFAYQGQIHTKPFEVARRVALAGRIVEGHIQYHPDWPEVTGLSGLISVGGRDVHIDVERGQSFAGTDLSGSHIHLVDNASFADVALQSVSTVEEALQFIRTTPLQEWMAFVTPDWAGTGPLRMSGRLKVPLNQQAEHIGEVVPEDQLEVDMDIALEGADLNLPSYGVRLGMLEGEMHYTYPFQVSGEGVRGRIFDRPAVFGASADSDTVIFHVDGQAPYEEVLTLLDMRDPGGINGGFDFLADLHIELAGATSRLNLVSDLTGLGLELPGEFAKEPDETVPSELELRFLDAYQSVRFRYGTARGWLHVNEVPLRGAIGFSAAPPMIESGRNALILGGRVQGFSLDEVVPDGNGEGGPMLGMPLVLDGLTVGDIDVSGVSFAEVTLTGEIGSVPDGDLRLTLASEDLQGTLVIVEDAPLKLDLDMLRLPPPALPPASTDPGLPSGDPLSVEIIPELVDADVSVDRFVVGETEYGSWSFNLRPAQAGIALHGLRANLRGVDIAAEKLFWDGASNRTWFEGTLTATDLATVLPAWGYAASVTTEAATMEADLNWQGSPAAVDLTLLVGQAAFEAKSGRFLEVTQGADAMKIFSLVNFSTIAKRLNFDFSDVVGEGVSFDRITATTEFREGSMQFLKPMAVDGSGSNFRIGGTVDLVDGILDNEMIVTLPVTKGLPWYAAYVALANPLAGLGVLVGERVLRKPLEQFSSAKYEISGTLEEPELKFVGVWDTTMNEPQVSLEPIEGEAAELEPAGVPAEPKAEPGGMQDEEVENGQTGTTS